MLVVQIGADESSPVDTAVISKAKCKQKAFFVSPFVRSIDLICSLSPIVQSFMPKMVAPIFHSFTALAQSILDSGCSTFFRAWIDQNV